MLLKKVKNSEVLKRVKKGWKQQTQQEVQKTKTKLEKFGTALHTFCDVLVIVGAVGLLAFEQSTNWSFSPVNWYNTWKVSQAKSKKQKDKLLAQQKQTALASNNLTILQELKRKNGYITKDQVDKYGKNNKMYIITDPQTGVEYYYANPNINSISGSGNSNSMFVMQPRLTNKNTPVVNPFWQIRQKKNVKSGLTDQQKTDILEKLSAQDFKGSVLIIRNNKIAFNEAINTKYGKSTPYPINSVQKNITALMLYQKLSKRHISLDTKIARWYPNLPGANQIKVRNLLNMTSGLALNDLAYKQIKGKSDLQIVDLLSKQATFNPALLGTPKYSSFNYILLSGILMKVTGRSYSDLINRNIIHKLGLKHSFLAYENNQFPLGHTFDNSNLPEYKSVKMSKQFWHNMLGAGSLVMSTHDLVRVIRFELNNNQAKNNVWNNAKRGYYSGGFYNMGNYYETNGAGAGYYTVVRVSKDGKNLIVIQTNYTKGNFDELKNAVDDIFRNSIVGE